MFWGCPLMTWLKKRYVLSGSSEPLSGAESEARSSSRSARSSRKAARSGPHDVRLHHAADFHRLPAHQRPFLGQLQGPQPLFLAAQGEVEGRAREVAFGLDPVGVRETVREEGEARAARS
jgi:hypothetical protein